MLRPSEQLHMILTHREHIVLTVVLNVAEQWFDMKLIGDDR